MYCICKCMLFFVCTFINIAFRSSQEDMNNMTLVLCIIKMAQRTPVAMF